MEFVIYSWRQNLALISPTVHLFHVTFLLQKSSYLSSNSSPPQRNFHSDFLFTSLLNDSFIIFYNFPFSLFFWICLSSLSFLEIQFRPSFPSSISLPSNPKLCPTFRFLLTVHTLLFLVLFLALYFHLHQHIPVFHLLLFSPSLDLF